MDRDRHAQRAKRAQGALKQLRSVHSRDALHSQSGSMEEQGDGDEDEDELFDVRPVPDVIHTTPSVVPPLPHQPVSLQAMFSSTMPNIPPLRPLTNQHIISAGTETAVSSTQRVTDLTPTATASPPVPASVGAMLNLTYPSTSRSSDVQEILRALGL